MRTKDVQTSAVDCPGLVTDDFGRTLWNKG